MYWDDYLASWKKESRLIIRHDRKELKYWLKFTLHLQNFLRKHIYICFYVIISYMLEIYNNVKIVRIYPYFNYIYIIHVKLYIYTNLWKLLM